MAAARESEDQVWLRRFGYRVRAAREAVEMSQADVAHEADIHPTYLSGIESGRRNPSLVVIMKLARALGVPPGTLMTDEKKR